MGRNRTKALGKLYKKITNTELPTDANTTTEALQKVYEALTNDNKHHINVTDIIEDLATNWSGDGGGGGGSSDFSTATVTFTNTLDGPANVTCANLFQTDEINASSGLLEMASQESATVDVILYKGYAFADLEHGSFSVVSGDATISGNTVTINGDCTLSISSGTTPN